METVFSINLNPDSLPNLLMFKIMLGVLGCIAVSLFCIHIYKKYTFKNNIKIIVLMLISLSGWLMLPSVSEIRSMGAERLKPYFVENHEVTKGQVKVLRTQPKSGHAPGDLINVSGQFFEIAYSKSDPFYSQPISHGGYLVDGVYVEIHHVNNKIFRIDVLSGK